MTVLAKIINKNQLKSLLFLTPNIKNKSLFLFKLEIIKNTKYKKIKQQLKYDLNSMIN